MVKSQDPHLQREPQVPQDRQDPNLIPLEDIVVGDSPIPQYEPPEPPSSQKPFVEVGLTRDEEVSQLRAQMAQLQATVDANTASTRQAKVGDRFSLGDEGYNYQYYRRPPGGPMGNWIVILPGGRNSRGQRPAEQYSHYIAKGFEPIEKYGPAPKPTTQFGARWLAPILRRGGAIEFPVSQVLAYKWHVLPPVEGIKFPQIEKLSSPPVRAECEDEMCEWDMYAEAGDNSITSSFIAHMQKRHEYPRAEAIAAAIDQGLPRSAKVSVTYDQLEKRKEVVGQVA